MESHYEWITEPIHEWAVIMAGGDGTRLRELSYSVSGDLRPKHFCEFFGGKGLLARARERLRPISPDACAQRLEVLTSLVIGRPS